MASRAALAARRLSASLAEARPALCAAPLPLPPCAAAQQPPAWQRAQRRGLNFWEVFSKERVAARRAEIEADIRQGYFADLKKLKQDGGKLVPATSALEDAGGALAFPKGLRLVDSRDAAAALPLPGAAVTLLLVLSRAGAQPALDSWAVPFAERCPPPAASPHDAAPAGPSCALAQLSLVESTVMSLPLLRRAILRGGEGGGPSDVRAKTRRLFLFGDAAPLRRTLTMPNRFAGYAFLLDARGRVRWRASGIATSEEVQAMHQATDALLAEARP